MTPEIKSKIDEKSDEYGFQIPYNGTDEFYNKDKVVGFQSGATFGYSLAEGEIERLKGLIKNLYTMYNREVMFPDTLEKHWQQFKTNNNL